MKQDAPPPTRKGASVPLPEQVGEGDRTNREAVRCGGGASCLSHTLRMVKSLSSHNI